MTERGKGSERQKQRKRARDLHTGTAKWAKLVSGAIGKILIYIERDRGREIEKRERQRERKTVTERGKGSERQKHRERERERSA